MMLSVIILIIPESSPARGTWIEIVGRRSIAVFNQSVVPRKGDVDRNKKAPPGSARTDASSPARGTWIEMLSCAGWPC